MNTLRNLVAALVVMFALLTSTKRADAAFCGMICGLGCYQGTNFSSWCIQQFGAPDYYYCDRWSCQFNWSRNEWCFNCYNGAMV
jgi:hypothetical protein